MQRHESAYRAPGWAANSLGRGQYELLASGQDVVAGDHFSQRLDTQEHCESEPLPKLHSGCEVPLRWGVKL